MMYRRVLLHIYGVLDQCVCARAPLYRYIYILRSISPPNASIHCLRNLSNKKRIHRTLVLGTAAIVVVAIQQM